jgi:hypothetical protein
MIPTYCKRVWTKHTVYSGLKTETDSTQATSTLASGKKGLYVLQEKFHPSDGEKSGSKIIEIRRHSLCLVTFYIGIPEFHFPAHT